MMDSADVAIVGAGIVGLAFAWEAAKRGKSVVVFERTAAATGASVRNFGMIWPIGQPFGELHHIAMKSRAHWLELASLTDIDVNPCGSIHAVYHAVECDVLAEFATLAEHECEYLSPADAIRRFPTIRTEGLKGVLYSPTELCVDPRQAVPRLAKYLADAYGVRLHFQTAVVNVGQGELRTAAGNRWQARQIIVASGTDFETLFPAAFADSGIRRCKLQMMRTATQPGGWKLGPHMAGGLTLGHYRSFAACRTLDAARSLHCEQYAEYGRHGIHVMASQNALGEVVIGDSHDYDDASNPFDHERIDRLILDYLAQMLKLPDPTIVARWHGHYAKHPTEPLYVVEPVPGCTVVAALGGAGMTMSFGFASRWWDAR